MTDDVTERFLATLAQRHDGEVYGEGVFAGLAETGVDAAQRHKWRVCEALERETKQLLARELAERGRGAVEGPERRKQGEELGRRLRAVPWEMLMKGLRPELVKFVTESFVDRELAGRADDSVAPVLALLSEPPSPT